MRLGFHYHIPAVVREDGIYMPGYLGCFIDSLAALTEKLVCFLHSPRSDEAGLMDYRVLSGNVELVTIGPHTSVIDRTLKARAFTTHLYHYRSGLDILLLRGPSPLLPAMAAASPVPTALLLVGDYVAGVNDLSQPRWRKEAIRLWSYWNKWGQNRAARRSLTFVNSRVLCGELSNKIPDLCEIRTTTLTAKDFFIRADTCQTPPYRLLYVGRMDRTKGLLLMVEAVSLLTQRGEQVELDLVGWPEAGDSILEEIQALAVAENIDRKVKYLGARPLGPQLFECYQQADIFLIASFASEGFPRVIWEAMANSLPVVATKVGSIPALIEGAAELVEPNHPKQLAEAISRLLYTPALRREYIRKGMALARQNTLEIQTKLMVTAIKDWLER